MRAIQFNEYGGPEVLQIGEAEEPHAGDGQLRIKVKAAGVNQLDWKLRAGYLHDFMPMTFPAPVGFEAAGIVDEVGEGVSGFAVGDAVGLSVRLRRLAGRRADCRARRRARQQQYRCM